MDRKGLDESEDHLQHCLTDLLTASLLNQELMSLSSHDTQRLFGLVPSYADMVKYMSTLLKHVEAPVPFFPQHKEFQRHSDEMRWCAAFSQFTAQEVFQSGIHARGAVADSTAV